MHEKRYRYTEKTDSAGFPIGVMLISATAIAVYLIVGSEILDHSSRDVVVYLPQIEAK